jgi:hypothetical protein
MRCLEADVNFGRGWNGCLLVDWDCGQILMRRRWVPDGKRVSVAERPLGGFGRDFGLT